MKRMPEGFYDKEWPGGPDTSNAESTYEDDTWLLTRGGVVLPAKVCTLFVIEAFELDDGRAVVFASDWPDFLPEERVRALDRDTGCANIDIMDPEYWERQNKVSRAIGLPVGHWKWERQGEVPLTEEELKVWREFARSQGLPEDPAEGLPAYYLKHRAPYIRPPRIRIYLLDQRGRIRDQIASRSWDAKPSLTFVHVGDKDIEFTLYEPGEVYRLRVLDRPCITWLPRYFWHAKLGLNWMVVEVAPPRRNASRGDSHQTAATSDG